MRTLAQNRTSFPSSRTEERGPRMPADLPKPVGKSRTYRGSTCSLKIDRTRVLHSRMNRIYPVVTSFTSRFEKNTGAIFPSWASKVFPDSDNR
jgi:hypothetical protein